jgi:hypothetical protein
MVRALWHVQHEVTQLAPKVDELIFCCSGPTEEVAYFWSPYADGDAAAWDRQIEAEVAAGRLDSLGAQALRESSTDL